MSQSRRLFTVELKREALQLMQREGLSQAGHLKKATAFFAKESK